jgi:PRTRC genetic system protein E
MAKPQIFTLIPLIVSSVSAKWSKPKKVREDENPAPTMPLSYTGTPEELDAEIDKHLAGYVECHIQLGSTLAQVKVEMEAAAKAAQEEARKKAAERSRKTAEKPVTSAGSAPVGSAPASPAATMTLFEGSQPTGSGATIPTTAATASAAGAQEVKPHANWRCNQRFQF